MVTVCLPGVYAVRTDTEILLASLAAERFRVGARVLDLGTGTGALAVAAAVRGAAVTAVDVSRLALASASVEPMAGTRPGRILTWSGSRPRRRARVFRSA